MRCLQIQNKKQGNEELFKKLREFELEIVSGLTDWTLLDNAESDGMVFVQRELEIMGKRLGFSFLVR